MRSWLPFLLGLSIAFALLYLSMLPFRWATVKRLRKMTREELEQSVFRYEDGYFQFIGPDHPDVKTFKSLVEARNLRGIQSNWRRLERSFMRLEGQTRYRGRPLIMDYYDGYELNLRELARRGT